MKKIILFLYLSNIFIYADHNLSMPRGKVLDNAYVVSLNGWDKAIQPLQMLLKKEGKTYIESFLKAAKEPYKPIKKINDIPQFILSRDDYVYAMAYAKYLESIGENDKSIGIYKISLSGLHHVVPKNEITLIGLIYKTVLERTIIQSIFNSLDLDLYTNRNKQNLKQIIQSNTMLTTDYFYNALENERKSIMYTLEDGLMKNLQTPQRIDHYITDLPNNISLEALRNYQVNLTKDVLQRVNNNYIKLHKKAQGVSNKYDVDLINKEVERQKIQADKEFEVFKYDTQISQLKNRKNQALVIGDYIFYSAVIKFDFKLDVLENIRLNKELMQRLDTK